MGSTYSLIVNISTPEYKKIIVETSDGKRYFSDLSPLSQVYCFPKNKIEWDKVSSDSFGLALAWTTRFEVHLDQVIGLSYKSELIEKTA